MPRRIVPLVPQQYYHVYNRGHNKDKIFFELKNYKFFLNRFRKYVAGNHAQVIAYVLMPNHYHFLLEISSEDFSIAMQKFSISYVKSINKRYNRTGSLFEGAFQARRIDRNEYLLHLPRYIHLNPVLAGLVRHPEDWVYSSYREYIGLRNGTLPRPDIILSQFQTSQTSEISEISEVYRQYQLFVEDYRLEELDSINHLTIE